MATDSTPPTDAATPQVPTSRFGAPERERERAQAMLDRADDRERRERRAIDMTVEQLLHDRVDNDFTYHAPRAVQVPRYDAIRHEARKLARLIVNLTPPSREQSTALTKLEEAVFHANAAVARHG